MTSILVAEDDDGVRQLILVTLRRSGHTVIEAANGGEAMAVLEQPDIVVDLLVSDVNMPGVSGLELVDFARMKRPRMPAILASGTNRWRFPPDGVDRDVTLLEATLDQLPRRCRGGRTGARTGHDRRDSRHQDRHGRRRR